MRDSSVTTAAPARPRRKRSSKSSATGNQDFLLPTPERISQSSKAGGGSIVTPKHGSCIIRSFDQHYRRKKFTYEQWEAGDKLLRLHARAISDSGYVKTKESIVDNAYSDGPQFSSTFAKDEFFTLAAHIPVPLRPAFNWFINTNFSDSPIRTLGCLYDGAIGVNAENTRGFLMLTLLLNHLLYYWSTPTREISDKMYWLQMLRSARLPAEKA